MQIVILFNSLCNILRLMSHLVSQLNENLSMFWKKTSFVTSPSSKANFKNCFIVAHKILNNFANGTFRSPKMFGAWLHIRMTYETPTRRNHKHLSCDNEGLWYPDRPKSSHWDPCFVVSVSVLLKPYSYAHPIQI